METDLKILAIDDNRDNLMALRAVLADRLPESRLLTALNGPQGLELARAENPVVILLDIIMPGMDGYEVCRELKKDERLQTIPVLFLTALKTDRDRRIKALEAGAEGFLSKPLDEIELVAQIRAMVKIKAANQLLWLEKKELAVLVAERTEELEQELAERKRAEEKLKKSEAEFRRLSQEFNGLLDAIPDSLTLLGQDRKVLWANRVAAESIGMTAEGLAGRYCYALCADRATFCEPCPVMQCFASATPQDETVTSSDNRVWDIRTVPLLDEQGKVAKVIELQRDITEHKKLEKQYLHAQKMESIGTLPSRSSSSRTARHPVPARSALRARLGCESRQERASP
jgi:CheY-like chemotaxis protein